MDAVTQPRISSCKQFLQSRTVAMSAGVQHDHEMLPDWLHALAPLMNRLRLPILTLTLFLALTLALTAARLAVGGVLQGVRQQLRKDHPHHAAGREAQGDRQQRAERRHEHERRHRHQRLRHAGGDAPPERLRGLDGVRITVCAGSARFNRHRTCRQRLPSESLPVHLFWGHPSCDEDRSHGQPLRDVVQPDRQGHQHTLQEQQRWLRKASHT